MSRSLLSITLLLATTVLSGCIGDDLDPFTTAPSHFSDADARIRGAVDGLHDDRLCVPEPTDHGDDVHIKAYYKLDGQGTIQMTGRDGPEKVTEIDGETEVLDDRWYHGWNTGEICIDVALDAKGEYAFGAYLD